jgi:hypothetical protein
VEVASGQLAAKTSNEVFHAFTAVLLLTLKVSHISNTLARGFEGNFAKKAKYFRFPLHIRIVNVSFYSNTLHFHKNVR